MFVFFQHLFYVNFLNQKHYCALFSEKNYYFSFTRCLLTKVSSMLFVILR